MPTVFRAEGFRVYFWSHEPGEPPHVHVDRAGATAKVWLEPVATASNAGFATRELRTVLNLVQSQQALLSWSLGMASSTEAHLADIRVRAVTVTEDEITVDLMDGRTITAPLAWYPRLANATPAERAHWEIAGAGFGIHWPDIDEDLSTEGLLRGMPAPPGSQSWRSPVKE